MFEHGFLMERYRDVGIIIRQRPRRHREQFPTFEFLDSECATSPLLSSLLFRGILVGIGVETKEIETVEIELAHGSLRNGG
jgi:hypothetical protein